MPNTQPITPEQQALFALGSFSGLSFHATGDDIDLATFKLISIALANAAPTIGTWNIVWGPAVVVQPIGGPYTMNTLYVAQSKSTPSQYAIGIAGTNPRSILDWIIEDGFVHWQVPWIYALRDAPSARIALGTAIGLAILQNMKPSSTVPGGGSTLTDFLATVTTSRVQISVVGHSLGGALAPTVALWLTDTQGFLSHWDPHKRATLSALPTAGPTAGNAAFASYSGKKLGERLTPYYNTLDVVPHAWQSSTRQDIPTLQEIPTLYVPHIPELPLIDRLVKLAIELSANGDYTTLPGLTPLPGTYKDVKGLLDLEKFLLEAAYQHTSAYDGWFHFNPAWLPGPPLTLRAPSAALLDALSKSPPGAPTLASSAPRKAAIDGTVVELPSHPADPRGAQAVAQVTAELQKHGVRS
jgi:hypothetical protein